MAMVMHTVKPSLILNRGYSLEGCLMKWNTHIWSQNMTVYVKRNHTPYKYVMYFC